MIGTTLSHFKITAKLGEGGMGEVYRAEDIRLKRQVALKVLPRDLATNPERLERFQREAETLAALDHPNIVHIFSVEESDGLHFLTMQLVDGKTLSELIPDDGMSADKIFDVAIPLADALAAAHERGVIHRDLKPGNIMVTEDGRVKVLDFGLAKLRREEPVGELTQAETAPLTEEGRVLGTVPYMSPEQLSGKPADQRADVFALGVVLYEIVSGKRPFHGESSIELVSSILKDSPPPVSEGRAELPRHLGRIIEHCLAKDPMKRYQSVLDVKNELESLREEVKSGSATTASDAALQVGSSPSFWSKKSMALIAGVILVSFVSVAVWWGRDDPTSGSSGAANSAPNAADGGGTPSLAVLPFVDMSPEKNQEYFADGITEALISNLAKISSLRVISRTSAMRYKNADQSLPEIAAELGVEYVVEGSALRIGEKVRITADLVHAADERHMWSESYDRGVADILGLQKEVSRAVSDSVRVQLTPEDLRRLEIRKTVDPVAHELYLRGRYYWNQRTPEALYRGLALFEEAVAKDPSYAAAHAGIGLSNLTLHAHTSDRTQAEWFADARRAAETALSLDGESAEAHLVLADVKLHQDLDWDGAEFHFDRALELNPGESTTLIWSMELSVARSDISRALDQVARAVEVDPLSPIVNNFRGIVSFYARRYEESRRHFLHAVEVAPELYSNYAGLALVYGQLNRCEDALVAAEKSLELSPDSPSSRNAVVWVAARCSPEVEAGRQFARFLPRDGLGSKANLDVATVYAELGDIDQAFESLDRAVEGHDAGLFALTVDPRFDILREDPRFLEVLKRIGLDDSI
jgi:serine/threonine protein kinase/Flp pilus assembly protein TadD